MSEERFSTQIIAEINVLKYVKERLEYKVTYLKMAIDTYQTDNAMRESNADHIVVATHKVGEASEELYFVNLRIDQLTAELAIAERGKEAGKKFGF